jgi:hypothetical protein
MQAAAVDAQTRDGCSVFDVATAFVELPTDKIDLLGTVVAGVSPARPIISRL